MSAEIQELPRFEFSRRRYVSHHSPMDGLSPASLEESDLSNRDATPSQVPTNGRSRSFSDVPNVVL
jgi:hypothetical protein